MSNRPADRRFAVRHRRTSGASVATVKHADRAAVQELTRQRAGGMPPGVRASAAATLRRSRIDGQQAGHDMQGRLTTLALAATLAACATTNPVKPAEIASEVKSVTYVQNGKQPARVGIGAVDGKTSWSNYSITGQRLNESTPTDGVPGPLTVTGKQPADAVIGAGLEIVSAIGKSIADSSMKDDPQFYDRLFARMIGSRELALETGRGVLPALAQAWQQPYSDGQLVVLPLPSRLDDAEGRYTGTDPGTDLVMVYTLDEVLLSEKPSSRALKGLLTFGMYDKEVMPYFQVNVAVYRRQAAGGSLHKLWSTRCGNGFQDAPAAEWTALRDAPESGRDLLDKTVPRVVSGCGEMFKRQLASS